MIRLSLIALILSSCLFAGPVSFCTEADAAFCPSLQFTIDGNDLSDQFTITPIATGQEYSIAADFTDPISGLTIDFDAATSPDPVIGFGMSFSGSSDPDVFFSVTTPYSGEVNFSEFADFFTGAGTGFNGGTLPTPNSDTFPDATYTYEFLVNGTPVDLEDPTGDPLTFGNFPSSGNLTLEGGLNVGPNVLFSTQGAGGFVPEPGTLALMGFGALAMAGAAWRRRRIR
jgi:hypothetical protein